jgi:riboflavin kinase / FMN adenylyltransferase
MLIETDYRALNSAGQDGLPLAASEAVIVIGNFDGVHNGHRALIGYARQIADKKGLKLTALTFSPHPRHYFRPDQPPFLLTDPVQKHEKLIDAGADTVVSIKFDVALADLSPHEFTEDVLHIALCAKHVIVGENFVFGKGRTGTVETLKEDGRKYGFGVSPLPVINNYTGERISSERIRESLRHGHVASAEEMLGNHWQLRGEVIRGNQKGRTIGFPTANVALGDYLQPAFGVYTALVQIEGQMEMHKAVVNIGQRPTVGSTRPLIEAHLLDFAGDLYGSILRVNLLDFVRPEQKFADFNVLKAQIHKDVAYARERLV